MDGVIQASGASLMYGVAWCALVMCCFWVLANRVDTEAS
ncbi:hypothetical protein XCR_1302 [Xanthomonas campestris pv. raphani 756C]|nr:hypothetical protein XCR_1302 [Xanthomonas campestris pv. raphani 756C]